MTNSETINILVCPDGSSLDVPDHSTVSRRLGKLQIALPVISEEQAVHLVVDSTGVKVYGEGEWKTRPHGISKRRTWRKLHLGVWMKQQDKF